MGWFTYHNIWEMFPSFGLIETTQFGKYLQCSPMLLSVVWLAFEVLLSDGCLLSYAIWSIEATNIAASKLEFSRKVPWF